MPGAVAAIIVTILWALVAGALALLGRKRLREAPPLAPKRAQEGIKEDVRVARERLRAGRDGEIQIRGRSTMSERTEDLRREIEESRERLGDTAGAIGYKADAFRADARPGGAVKSRITGAKSRVSQATPSAEDARQGARQAVGMAQENPLGLAVASLAAGLLVGLLPSWTRIEDERIGPVTDTVKERAGELAGEAIEHRPPARSPGRSASRRARSPAPCASRRARSRGSTGRPWPTAPGRPPRGRNAGPRGGRRAPARTRDPRERRERRPRRPSDGRAPAGMVGGAETDRPPLPRGQHDRLGGGAHLLRGAVAVPGAACAGRPPRRRRPGAPWTSCSRWSRTSAQSRRRRPCAAPEGVVANWGGAGPPRPRHPRGAVVGVRLHRCLHPRRQRDLAGRGGPPSLETEALPDPRDGRRGAPAVGHRHRPGAHRPDRRIGRRGDRTRRRRGARVADRQVAGPGAARCAPDRDDLLPLPNVRQPRFRW